MKHLPLSLVNESLNREAVKYEPICFKTLMKYMELVLEAVRARIEQELPKRFGLIFDVWSDGSGGHLVGVYAKYCAEEAVQNVIF